MIMEVYVQRKTMAPMAICSGDVIGFSYVRTRNLFRYVIALPVTFLTPLRRFVGNQKMLVDHVGIVVCSGEFLRKFIRRT